MMDKFLTIIHDMIIRLEKIVSDYGMVDFYKEVEVEHILTTLGELYYIDNTLAYARRVITEFGEELKEK